MAKRNKSIVGNLWQKKVLFNKESVNLVQYVLILFPIWINLAFVTQLNSHGTLAAQDCVFKFNWTINCFNMWKYFVQSLGVSNIKWFQHLLPRSLHFSSIFFNKLRNFNKFQCIWIVVCCFFFKSTVWKLCVDGILKHVMIFTL